MDQWFHCWNCTFETLQERKHYEIFYRGQEVFSKNADGRIKERGWLSLASYHAFLSCKKCDAPNYLVDEYVIRADEDPREIREEFWQALSLNGLWRKDRLYKDRDKAEKLNRDRHPEWTKSMPEDLMLVLWEVYGAYRASLPILCAMGIRTAIDLFALSKVGDVGGFAQKLKRLKEDGHISTAQHSALSVVIEVGHAANHRGFRPTKQHIEQCLDVLEAIMVFEGGADLNALRASVPSRSKNDG